MTRKSRPFQEILLERLAHPIVAKEYLNEALDESPESFLNALKTVAQARQIAKVAKDAGVQRETLYRSLSSKGNPTLGTLSSILKAVGLKVIVDLEGTGERVFATPPPTLSNTFVVGEVKDKPDKNPKYSFLNELDPTGDDAYISPLGGRTPVNAWNTDGAFKYAACSSY